MRRVFIFLILLVLAQQLKASDLEGIYFNLSGITVTPGLDKGFRYRASLGYLAEEPRIGVGAAFEWIPRKNPNYRTYKTEWYTPVISEKTSSNWNLFRIPIEFYYFPYVSTQLRETSFRSAMYFYVSISPWSVIQDSSGDYDWEDLSINGVSSNEFGVGYTIGAFFDIRLAYSNLYTSGLQNAHFNFPEYSEKKWFIALDFYFGGWPFPSSIKTGWFPAIKEEIENARYVRENARPKIYSYYPKKPVSGSEFEIKGDNFRAEENRTSVFFNNYSAEIISITSSEILVRIPGNVPAGDVKIQVKTAKGYSDEENVFIIPSKPPLLAISDIKFLDENGDSVLSADEGAKIGFAITNRDGAGKAFGLKAQSYIKNLKNPDLDYPSTVAIGDLDGETKTVEIPLKAGLDLHTGELVFNIKISEANDFAPDSFEIKIKTQKLDLPDLQIAKIEVDDKFYPDKPGKLSIGNGNSIIEQGEAVEVVVMVVNKGAGPSRETKINVSADNSDLNFLSASDFKVGSLKSGEWTEVKFTFSIKKSYSGSENLPLKLFVEDARWRFNKNLPLSLKLKKSYPKIEMVAIKGEIQKKSQVEIPTFGDELLRVPQSSVKENKNAVAVVIGVKDYKNKYVPSVDYAINDAQLVKEYLVSALGFQQNNIIYLENPTKANMEEVFGNRDNYKGKLYDYVKKDKSDVFVYYTGHGAPDLDTRQGYFVPSDSDPNYVKLNGYSLSVFYDNLSKLRAKNVNVVIDACFSGMSNKGMIITKASPLMIAPILPGSGKIKVFASSNQDEVSSWYPEKRHSLFTYFFLKGLQGEADKNKDKTMTYGELYDYVFEHVPYYARRLYGRKQTPSFNGNEKEIISRY
ncbi:MAG: caspase family protein [Elusimicrobia bacterium]|nr:caspase family protein [Elusimicrobiota bacterium]